MGDSAVIISKVGSMVLLSAIAVFGAILPIYLRKLKLATTIKLCTAFAGGAFLSLGMFHILPEAIEDLDDAGVKIWINDHSYNLTYIFLFLGFVLILFCESIVFKEELEQFQNRDSSGRDIEKATTGLPTSTELSLHSDTGLPSSTGEPSMSRNISPNGSIGDDESSRTQRDLVKKDSSTFVEVFRSGSLFIMFALAMHGIFEGIVVGTDPDLVGVWLTTAVIFGHKWAESFSLMLQFLDAKVSRGYVWALMTTFILSTPLGIAIGIAVRENKAASGICNALGAGTIIYVATELTTEVFSTGSQIIRFLSFLFFLLGGAFVLTLTFVEMLVEG